MGLPYNENLVEAIAVLATVPPGTTATATAGPVNMAGMGRVLLLLNSTSAGAATVQAKQSTTSGGSYTNISGAALTISAGSAQTNELEVRAESLGSGGQWVEFVITISAGTFAGNVLGSTAAYDPASDYNITAVQTPVVV